MHNNNTIWKLIRSQHKFYGAAILAMGLSNAFLFGVPLVARYAIDGLINGDHVNGDHVNGDHVNGDNESLPVWLRYLLPLSGDADTVMRYLWAAALVMVAFTAVAGVFQYCRNALAAGAAEAIVRCLRDRLYGHIERLPCAYLDRSDTGDLVQRCTSDVETVRIFLANQVVEIGRTGLLVAMVTPLLFWLDAKMALVSLILLPVIFVFAYLYFRRVQTQFLLTDEAEARMTTVLQENLTGIRVVRAFARQNFERDKFAMANGEFRDRNQRLLQLLGIYWASADFLCLGQIGLVLFYGGSRVLHNELSVGDLFAFLSYLGLIVWPLRQLGRVLTETGKALVSIARLREVLDEAPESQIDLTLRDKPLAGAIEVRGLRFGFTEPPVLKDISFRVKPGETIALIGPPGAGKSTLVQLLLRLYDYQKGSIMLDGRELSGLNRQFVRSQIGVVLQEPFLYSTSIAANLRVGRSDASFRELQEASMAASIHDSIMNFSRGYDTPVGERGVTLSGGQRQRLALARALLKDPPILILDDALSAVDTRTEAAILEALGRRRGLRTTLIIAHRLSSVAHADLILVLNQGRVAQAGTHSELSAMPGPYRRLWEIQDGLEQSLEEDLEPVAETGR